MTTVKLKIAELRKDIGIGQQDLAEVLGVSFQSVSKVSPHKISIIFYFTAYYKSAKSN